MECKVEAMSYMGLDCWRLSAGAGSAVVARQGAQVLSWSPADGVERLFLSERARFDGVSPIRGGIPVCFPQFSGLGGLPKHGLVRTRGWDMTAADTASGASWLELRTGDDRSTRAVWAHAWEAKVRVVLEPGRLDVGFTVRNQGDEAFSFTGALHTYLAVDDIAGASLSGLQGVEYRDAADGDAVRLEQAEPLFIQAEVDRVYHDAPRKLLLRDGARRLLVAATGFPDVVVWNPWSDLCARLPDMSPGGYRRMLCVEAAVARVPATVPPGAQWCARQVLAPA
jgi:glucose-6-phosphate 1-epimerase